MGGALVFFNQVLPLLLSFTWSVGPVSALTVTSISFCLFHYSGDGSGSIPGSDNPGCAGNPVSHIHTIGSAHHSSSDKKILTLFQNWIRTNVFIRVQWH